MMNNVSKTVVLAIKLIVQLLDNFWFVKIFFNLSKSDFKVLAGVIEKLEIVFDLII